MCARLHVCLLNFSSLYLACKPQLSRPVVSSVGWLSWPFLEDELIQLTFTPVCQPHKHKPAAQSLSAMHDNAFVPQVHTLAIFFSLHLISLWEPSQKITLLLFIFFLCLPPAVKQVFTGFERLLADPHHNSPWGHAEMYYNLNKDESLLFWGHWDLKAPLLLQWLTCIWCDSTFLASELNCLYDIGSTCKATGSKPAHYILVLPHTETN